MYDQAGPHVATWFKYVEIARKRKLWQLDYATWEEFCDKCLGKTVRQIQQLSADNRFLEVLSTKTRGTTPPNAQLAHIPQDGIKALRRLPGSEHVEALAEASRAAGDKAPTGPQIKAAVDRRLGGTAAAPPITDARGSPVTDPKFREVFEHGAKFMVFGRHVAAIKGMLREILEGPAGNVLAEQRQDIERDRQNILSAIKFSRPYAICPYCGGRQEKCQGCKGRGWVTKEAFDQSPAKA